MAGTDETICFARPFSSHRCRHRAARAEASSRRANVMRARARLPALPVTQLPLRKRHRLRPTTGEDFEEESAHAFVNLEERESTDLVANFEEESADDAVSVDFER